MVYRRLLAEINSLDGESLYERGKFTRTEHDAVVMAFIKARGPLTVRKAARLCHGVLLVSEVRRALKRLVGEGKLITSGTEYERVYSLADAAAHEIAAQAGPGE